MPRMARKCLESGFFHIMVQGISKEKIFLKKEYKEKYIYLIKFFLNKQNVNLISYCVMDNHVHIIIYAEHISELTKFMERLNTTYAMFYNKNENRVGYVFRDRFKSKLLNTKDYLAKCIKYVHMNPVKAGMVKEEKDYKYSSYNDYIEKKGIVSEELLRKIFDNKCNYLKQFVQIEYDEELFFEIEEEKITIEELKVEITNFLFKEKITIEELREDKRLIKKIYNNFKTKPTKAELARQLGITRTKISKIINK